MAKLTNSQVQTYLSQAQDAFPHDLCLTCECFLGYAAQLRMDADVDGKEVLAAYKVARKDIHPCLGCDPCPPGDCYSAYMRNKHNPALILL